MNEQTREVTKRDKSLDSSRSGTLGVNGLLEKIISNIDFISTIFVVFFFLILRGIL